MQVHIGPTKKLNSFQKLNMLLSRNSYSSSSASPALLPQKHSLSQHATRENSKENTSHDQDESIISCDAIDLTNGPEFNVEKVYDQSEETSSCFEKKTNDEMRRCYINKLVNMKILDLQPKKKTQNISIFDWDDTLFCTSFLGNQPFHKLPADTKCMVQALDATANRILRKAVKVSDVYIITNSDMRWVEQSAQTMLPKTFDVISRKNIKIISARNEYKDLYPEDLYRWKLEAFLSLKKDYQHDAMTNMIVLGDSDLEIRAGKALGAEFKKAMVKTVKFEESPNVEELIKQQRIVLNLFDEIFAGCKSMTVRLGKAHSQ